MRAKQNRLAAAAGVTTEYMRANESASYMRVSKRTFARMKAHGKIPFIRLSPGVVVYRKSDLDRVMDRLTVRATG